MSPLRLVAGGDRIDRSRPLTATFDGKPLAGFAGDTLASLLVAAGVRICAHGIYSGRPRGLMAAGAEEPNVFVQVLSGVGEPMVQATELSAYDGLAVRSLAGKGFLAAEPDVARYDKKDVHVETLVVGAGRSGVRAALAAAREGGRVLLADTGAVLAGEESAGSLAEAGVSVLVRTTVTGLYDAGYAVAVERRTDHLPVRPSGAARQRLWHIRAGRTVLATGALERPLAFPGNDLPGVLLADSAVRYIREYGVLPGRRAVVLTCHDGGLESAAAMAAAGVDISAVLDLRDHLGGAADARSDKGPVQFGAGHVRALAGEDGTVSGVEVRRPDGSGETFSADVLVVAGGWNPNLALFSTAGGRTVWSSAAAAFVPVDDLPGVAVVGRATGGRLASLRPQARFVIGPDDPDTTYLDLQRDATLADLRRAVGAGLGAPEHVKRYTTIATAADQGRTSNVLTVGALAEELGVPIESLAPTNHRPPYTPLLFGLLAGRDRGNLLEPERVTPLHDLHVAAGAVFEDVGQWKRPWYFPVSHEDMSAAVLRESAAVRNSVGMMDASTLGKIELQGADVGEFLDRMYTNLMSTLPVGRVRYGVLCGLDGMVMDDGTVARLTEDRWLATTTTGNAAKVLDWFEEFLQTEWPSLDVRCTSVTEQWATVVVAGPRSRDVVGAVCDSLDVSNSAFGFMEWRDATVRGCPVRVMRISFSGELAYELNVNGWYAAALWEEVYAAGSQFGITPYGTEAMHVLRAEKGYPIVGQDTDGTVTPHDLGMSWIVSKKKPDFIGKRSLARRHTAGAGRRQLVGLLPVDGRSSLVEGGQLIEPAGDPSSPPVPMVGHVTSAYSSPALGTPFGLALVADGTARHGQQLQLVDNGSVLPVRVTPPVLYDPEGSRRDGD